MVSAHFRPEQALDHRALKANELRHFSTSKPRKWTELAASNIYWARKFRMPKVAEVFGTNSVGDFFAKGFAHGKRPDEPIRVLSIGSGLCKQEEDVLRRLRAMGFQDVQVDCLEMSGERVQAVRNRFRESGLAGSITVTEQDINEWSGPARTYTGVMANHSLHHFIQLERIFAACDACLERDGRFVVNDMIGRNGHQRWPEALAFVEYLWDMLPRKYKYNHPFARYDDRFDNLDQSKKSYEGIRAQDILPLLNRRFRATHIVAEGGVIDIFVGRRYGYNFDPAVGEDAHWIDRIGLLNDALIDTGVIKPTMLFAWFEKKSHPAEAPPRQYRHWSQEFCTRHVDKEPGTAPAAQNRNPLAMLRRLWR